MKKLTIEQLRVLSVGPVDLEVDKGRCTGIRGAAGAGKTLLLRAIADMTEHTGRVSLDGIASRSMSGIAVSLDRFTQTAWSQKAAIEARLILGQEWGTAIGEIRKESIRSGLIPIINSMTVAGIVSLPGMMTNQPSETVYFLTKSTGL